MPYYKHHPQAILSQLVPALKYFLSTPRPPGDSREADIHQMGFTNQVNLEDNEVYPIRLIMSHQLHSY